VAGDVAGKVLGGGSSDIGGPGVRADSVTGAVGSVTGAVGSVTGAVGSVTGAVGSVIGSVGSLGAQAQTDSQTAAAAALTAVYLTAANVDLVLAYAAGDATRDEETGLLTYHTPRAGEASVFTLTVDATGRAVTIL
jgi:hypothetical protein